MGSEFTTGPRLEVASRTVNTADKTDLVAVIWGVNLTAFVLVGVIVPLRIIVRCTITRNFFSDDVLVIIAALFTFGICSLVPIAIDAGLGQHYWNLDVESLSDDRQSLLQLMFISNFLYPCAVAFTRLSAVCSFQSHIMHKSSRWIMFSAAAIISAFALASVTAVVFQCRPVSAAWDSTISDATCYPFLDFLHASTAISIAIDGLLCSVPLFYFWAMDMSLAKKMAITVLFAFSGLACAVAVINFVNLQQFDQTDVTYTWASWVLCSIGECTIGIVCISIPPIIALFTRLSLKKKEKSRRIRSKSLRYTFYLEKPTFSRAVAPRVIRPMATPWKDMPVVKTTNPDFQPDFRWLRLDLAEAGRRWDRTRQSSKPQDLLGIAI